MIGITDLEFSHLVSLEKEFTDSLIVFPKIQDCINLDLISLDKKESFKVDINRKSTYKVLKCTYQKRYNTSIPLFRIELDPKTHTNPDGETIYGPHIHVYREGYDDRYAYPLDTYRYNGNLFFSDPTDLMQTFEDFCRLCNVVRIPEIQESIA